MERRGNGAKKGMERRGHGWVAERRGSGAKTERSEEIAKRRRQRSEEGAERRGSGAKRARSEEGNEATRERIEEGMERRRERSDEGNGAKRKRSEGGTEGARSDEGTERRNEPLRPSRLSLSTRCLLAVTPCLLLFLPLVDAFSDESRASFSVSSSRMPQDRVSLV